jgi:hypothetical protein
MSIKPQWVQVTLNEWKAEYEGYALEAYRTKRDNLVFFRVATPNGDALAWQQVKGILTTAKRAAADWLAGYLGQAQAQALTLAEELERLQFMEARLLNALTFAKSEAERELLLQILGREVE